MRRKTVDIYKLLARTRENLTDADLKMAANEVSDIPKKYSLLYLLNIIVDMVENYGEIIDALVFTGTEDDLKAWREIQGTFGHDCTHRELSDKIIMSLEHRLVREHKTPQKSLDEVLGYDEGESTATG